MLQTIYLREDFDVNRTKQESATLPTSKKATSQSWQASRRKAGALMMLKPERNLCCHYFWEKKKKGAMYTTDYLQKEAH
jgi:hypothetical protein